MDEQPVQVATAAAAAEETVALYDACWFRRCVLLPSPLPARATGSAAAQAPPERSSEAQPVVSASRPTAALRHRRTRSDEASAAAFRQGLEPLRIPNNRARLETILSGKDGMVVAAPQPLPERTRRPEARWPAGGGVRRRRRQRRGRSMSELEFEELKGLQDLGFTFSDAEVDAELASVVPGLRRKRSGEETTDSLATASAPAAGAPRRPYLSEAWDDEEEEVRAMLRNWRIPAAVDGADLKEHLRVWAHTVASAVR